MKKLFEKKQIGNGLLAMGIGGLMAFYLIELSRIRLIPFSETLKSMIISGNIKSLGGEIFESLILLVSFFSMLTAPLLICWDQSAGKKILGLLFILFVDIAGIVSVIARGEIFLLYMIVIWVSAVYITWFCFGIFRILHQWIKKGTTVERYDIVKLTFIWTIWRF